MDQKQVILGAKDVQKQKDFRDEAELYASVARSQPAFKIETYDLTRGFSRSKPETVGFPFRSFIVLSATDSQTTAKLVLHSNRIPHIDNGLPLVENRALNLPYLVEESYIVADPQPGKSITIAFLRDGEVTSGRMIQQTSGGVSITYGSGITAIPKKTVTTSPAKILDADSDAQLWQLRNLGPNPIVLGGSGMTDDDGDSPGATVLDVNDSIPWQCQAETHSYSLGGDSELAISKHT